ncbi:hypothetical protein [Dyadobacter sp. NIV53]|uniref:hypothetical protein n=1 Tax=Dyadobacter sp. NIV53 TaxID=2861765 RepID=UPI001C847CFF|nr:hypothetical protein [Dyadobacter sp. NIV53]
MHIPTIETFTNNELVAFSVANPDLNVELNENGQLFINITPAFALSISNNSELIIWNRRHKTGKVPELNGGYFLKDSYMHQPEFLTTCSFEETLYGEDVLPDFSVKLCGILEY